MNIIDQLYDLRNRGIKVVSIDFILRELIPFYPNALSDEQKGTNQPLLRENKAIHQSKYKTS